MTLPDALRELRIDGERLLGRLRELGAVGGYATAGGESGSSRLACTDADRAGRDLVVWWMRDLGLDIRIDVVGNVIATRPGTDPTARPVMCGSHIDTVRTGGYYDGNLGVLAGIEVIETLEAAGVQTRHPISVAFFSNEEGARFSPDMMGSLVYCGGSTAEEAYDATDIDGLRFGDELARIGYLGTTPCPGEAPYAYVELHIEQGPVLDHEGVRMGAVTGVQGISWQELTITGQSNHAGTTPMRLRHDPGYAAARLAVAVREIANGLGDPQVGTVGLIKLHPNLVNVVAAEAVMTVDLRNTDEAVLRDSLRQFEEQCRIVESEEGVTITSKSLARFEPVVFDPRVVDLVETIAGDLGNSVRRLPSGAGHDAQMLARMCPTGMIFTPSVKGISHNPAEHTEPADLVMGANILLQAMLALSETDVVSAPTSPAPSEVTA